MTQQNPLAVTAAKTPGGSQTQLTTDASGANLKVSNVGDTGLSLSGPISVATQITAGPGELKSFTNLVASLSTVATSSLTTSQIGAFYDRQLNTMALSALTTAQVASLTTAQVVALALPNTIDQGFGGGNGLPITNGIVFVPGTAQVIDALKK